MARLVRGVAEILREYHVTKGTKTITVNPVGRMVQWARCKEVKAAAETLIKDYDTLLTALHALLPRLQEVCLRCSRTSNDDNLSRGGKTFVFLEAMPGAAGDLANDGSKAIDGDDGYSAGEDVPGNRNTAPHDDDENCASRGNWLNAHAIPTDKSSTKPYIMLPPEAEEGLRRMLAIFAQLTPVQAQIVHGLLNRRTIKDIADELGTSKQNCGNWFREARRRFPVLLSLAPRKTRESVQKSRYSED